MYLTRPLKFPDVTMMSKSESGLEYPATFEPYAVTEVTSSFARVFASSTRRSFSSGVKTSFKPGPSPRAP